MNKNGKQAQLNDYDCEICFNLMTAQNYPCVLKCGHSICHNCISSINNKCPFCKQNFDGRPTKNFYLLNKIEENSKNLTTNSKVNQTNVNQDNKNRTNQTSQYNNIVQLIKEGVNSSVNNFVSSNSSSNNPNNANRVINHNTNNIINNTNNTTSRVNENNNDQRNRDYLNERINQSNLNNRNTGHGSINSVKSFFVFFWMLLCFIPTFLKNIVVVVKSIFMFFFQIINWIIESLSILDRMLINNIAP